MKISESLPSTAVEMGCEKMLALRPWQDILQPLYLAIVIELGPSIEWREGWLFWGVCVCPIRFYFCTTQSKGREGRQRDAVALLADWKM